MSAIHELVLSLAGIRGHNRPMPIEDDDETWYTVAEAAAMSKKSRQRIHQYIDEGRLTTKQLGRLVLVSKTSLSQLHNKPMGRPKKSLTKGNK